MSKLRSVRSQAELTVPPDLKSGIDCSADPVITRQEAAADTDINNILARYGVNQQQRTDAIWGGESDDSVNLQTALEGVRELRDHYDRTNDAFRRQVPFDRFLAMLNAGKLTFKNKDPHKPDPLTPTGEKQTPEPKKD